jgi:hypothetical protein
MLARRRRRGRVHTRIFNQLYAVAVAYVMYVSVFGIILRSMRMHPYRACILLKIHTYVEKYAKIRIKYGIIKIYSKMAQNVHYSKKM